MKINRKNIIISVAIIVVLVIAVSAATVIISKLFHLDTYKEELLKEVKKSLNRDVSYEKGDFSLRFGPAFTFTKVIVKERDGNSAPFITADRLTFKIALIPLFEKKIVLKQMVVERPHVRLSRNREGAFNIDDLLEEKQEETHLQIKGVRVKDGYFFFSDRQIAPGGVSYALEDTDFSINHLSRGRVADVKFSTTIIEDGKKSVVTVSGKAGLPGKDKSLLDTAFDIHILARNLNAAHYWDYYSRYVPFRKVIGRLDLESSFKGRLNEFTSAGKVKVSGLRFDYPQVFHAVLEPKNLHFTYDMALKPNDVIVNSIDLTVDGANAKGSCSILDIHSGNPRIVAKATMPPVKLEPHIQYIPFGIIAKDTSEFIEKHVKGGTFRLDEGRLDGRVSEIAHMEKGDNNKVLSIRATALEGGLLSFGNDVPTFNSIKGELILSGKDFVLRNMSGRFGTSPMSLEGKITDYCLDTPSAYPFTMTTTPQRQEIAWLLGKKKGSKLSFSGPSAFRLTGSGFTSDFKLAGEWDLAGAAYSLPDLINKQANQANRISFAASLNKDGFNLSGLHYELQPLTLDLAARYIATGRKKLSVEARTNQFQAGAVATYLPAVKKHQPQGLVQLAVRGDGNTDDPEELLWKGDISMTGASFVLNDDIKRLSNISGTVRFKGDSLETSQLAARLGNSMIYGKGSLTGFKDPSFNLDFTSPALDLADLGLRSPSGELKLSKLAGNLSFHDGDLLIKSLSGQANNSKATLKGKISDLRAPKADLQATAQYLDIEDIIALTEIEKIKKGTAPSATPVSFKVRLNADAGRYNDIPFKKMQSDISYEQKILYLHPLDFSAFGGQCSADGRIDFGSDTAPRYQVNFSIDNVSSEQLFKSQGWQKAFITGALSAQGNLTAKGKTAAELKKTALGSVTLAFQEGKITRFPVLSKILSLLNVSQLLKFQLPDMVSGGMPYNILNASFSFRDGTASTEDLFIKSNAMNISAVGKVDMVKDTIDATVGVQPLQTVDKIVSKIPVVGWILTGKDKSLISTYFSVKGKLDDPTVEAIPVKYIAKGVFGIFKRVFQLPAKIFTDTGEVILGQ